MSNEPRWWMNYAAEEMNYVEAEGLTQRDAAEFLEKELTGFKVEPLYSEPISIKAHEHDEGFRCVGDDCPLAEDVKVWAFEVVEEG